MTPGMPMSTLWFVGAAALVAYALGVLLFLRHQHRAATADEASCGVCGYPRRGLPGPVCPECGSDVNIVGLRRPTWWNRRSPLSRRAMLVTAWTLAIGGAAALSWTPFHAYVQPGWQHFDDMGGLKRAEGAYIISFMRVWKTWMWPWQKRNGQPDAGWPVYRLEVQEGPGRWYVDAEPLPMTNSTWGWRAVFNAFIAERQYGWRVSAWAKSGKGSGEPADVLEEGLGEWGPALEHWTEIVAERHQLPVALGEVSAAMRAVLATPFAQLDGVDTEKFRCEREAYGFGWDCDKRFVFVFAAVWALLWLAGLVLIIRVSHRAPVVAAREVSTGEAVAP
jgi:hypothetical protein